MISNRFKEVLRESGFVLWDDDPNGEDRLIDWSSDYDDSIVLYTSKLVEEISDDVWVRILFETHDMDHDQKYLIRGLIYSILHDLKETFKNEKVQEV